MDTLYFNAMGRELLNYDQLSDLLTSEIATYYPEYVALPPLDDTGAMKRCGPT